MIILFLYLITLIVFVISLAGLEGNKHCVFFALNSSFCADRVLVSCKYLVTCLNKNYLSHDFFLTIFTQTALALYSLLIC